MALSPTSSRGGGGSVPDGWTVDVTPGEDPNAVIYRIDLSEAIQTWLDNFANDGNVLTCFDANGTLLWSLSGYGDAVIGSSVTAESVTATDNIAIDGGAFLVNATSLSALANTLLVSSDAGTASQIKLVSGQKFRIRSSGLGNPSILEVTDPADDTSFQKTVISGKFSVAIADNVPTDAEIEAVQFFLYMDGTNGAAKLKIKGKSANGTVVTGEVALA